MLRQYNPLTDAAFSLMPLCKYKRHRIHFIKEFIGAHNIKERPFSVENIV